LRTSEIRHNKGTHFSTPMELWKKKASQLRKLGYTIIVSNFLEEYANSAQVQKGEDIADFIIRELQMEQSFR